MKETPLSELLPMLKKAWLRELMEDLPRVTGFMDGEHFILGSEATPWDTHEALLFNLREISSAVSSCGDPNKPNPRLS